MSPTSYRTAPPRGDPVTLSHGTGPVNPSSLGTLAPRSNAPAVFGERARLHPLARRRHPDRLDPERHPEGGQATTRNGPIDQGTTSHPHVRRTDRCAVTMTQGGCP